MRKTLLLLGLLVPVLVPFAAIAGSLEPSGPPAPTMKTMGEVEPRTPLRNLFDAEPIAPITIDAPGSYYLTENVLGLSDQWGIRINASNVTLDLNGFSVLGNVEVLELDGIKVFGSNVVIRNGSIRGFDQDGINCQAGTSGVHLVDLDVGGNGGDGAQCASALIRGGDYSGNTGRGIVCGSNCLARGATVNSNAGGGMTLGGGSLIKGMQIAGNTGFNVSCPIAGGALLADSYIDGLITNLASCTTQSLVTP